MGGDPVRFSYILILASAISLVFMGVAFARLAGGPV